MNDVNIINSTDVKILRQQPTTTLVFEELCEASDGLCPLTFEEHCHHSHGVSVGNLNVSTLQNRSAHQHICSLMTLCARQPSFLLIPTDTLCVSTFLVGNKKNIRRLVCFFLAFKYLLRKTSMSLLQAFP